MATENNAPIHSAVVIRIDGNAYIRNEQGQLQAIKAGDRIEEGQRIVIDAQGQLVVMLDNGRAVDISGGQEFTADAEMLAPTGVDRNEAAVAQGSDAAVQNVIAALEAGQDPFNVLEPTAAGVAAEAGTAEGAHGFVRLMRIVEDTTPQGFEFSAQQASGDTALVTPATEDDRPAAQADAASQQATLAAPTVQILTDSNADGFINRAEQGSTGSATVKIDLPTGTSVGDTLTITDGQGNTQTHTITAEDLSNGWTTTVTYPAEGETLQVIAVVTTPDGTSSPPGSAAAQLD
ncbi:MAG: hypothetical protein CGU28_03065 [Candidatus Dactylopiibacterium carminicum]|uniref:Retention module-containing protein n=1 Tax=Candidatus Dactylopiibacterium carminicum TaxID=857335 RepID=A0A272EYE9_9RHOO|nr:retention module-containing protein [Candidatus Dactylopiibacterium carminicum]KAF7600635.1 hypothetical protein BGI27_01760 [Candidatus Dactylopiibacterium carminicum]PAS95131.1 MAG: hypothetical protein CGU29_01410 [Candidatus Dactylopiibacterium carminicum]PAS97935.1 MAG: hypothetical protein CGU28_03065 [Candidatus Dactylopiibacterium carminicum]PAT00633.1 MAG: hypothetical protein BSR46_01770 [Candidatus Dactylopiibacterium carminicum]